MKWILRLVAIALLLLQLSCNSDDENSSDLPVDERLSPQRTESQAFRVSDPLGFHIETLVSGLHNPTGYAYAPDGTIFIAEDDGLVQVYTADGQSRGIFLDLTDVVNHAGDRGLLGIAVDPLFQTNRRIYLSYTEDFVNGSTDS